MSARLTAIQTSDGGFDEPWTAVETKDATRCYIIKIDDDDLAEDKTPMRSLCQPIVMGGAVRPMEGRAVFGRSV
ncbi:hypothetical protein [Roseobacter sp. MH60115]|uniref:hypothetical protein n=1 Tax=Roseobacter sp. MH60115 TaxID=2785324 RepID=UPI0018A2B128|nr:hypothetical protein [Roseobacter sp. MH60115]